MIKDLVSIMIPTYNRPQLFEETLKSALAQDYRFVEVLVCDNSTNDETERLIQKYIGNPRLTYRRNKDAKTKEENFLPFREMAQGEYLQWLMDDDLIMPDKLTKMTAVLKENPQVALVTNQRGMIDGAGNALGQKKFPVPVKAPYSIYPAEFAAWFSLREFDNIFGEPTAYLFRRNDLTHHYWRAESKGLKTISDVAMAIELLEKGSLAIFAEPLSFYRRHKGQEGQQVDVAVLSRIEWDALNEEYAGKNVFPYTERDYRLFLRKIFEEYRQIFYKLAEQTSEDVWEKYMKLIDKAKAA